MPQIAISVLKKSHVDTLLGAMTVITSDRVLYFLQFTDNPQLESSLDRLMRMTQSVIEKGNTTVSMAVENELTYYFEGKLSKFTIPVCLLGTPFQQKVWSALQNIPRGTTQSYATVACMINKPRAYRGVAQANAANQIHIIVPCHRVITTSGMLGGYRGGINRKQWLLDHEKQ